MNVKKSSGIDNISTGVLKDFLIGRKDEFLHILNLSISGGIFPTKWKEAKIAPIPKVSNPAEVGDLRPISLLPITGKILEKCVHRQANEFLEHHNLITEKQSGFRKKRSTQDAVLHLNDDIFRALNNSEYVGATYIDYKKAFDTISHDKLIAKLPHYGFSPKFIGWFKSNLSTQVQKLSQMALTPIGRVYFLEFHMGRF